MYMIVVPLLTHNICLTRGPDTRPMLLQYLTPQLIIPALIITLMALEMALLLTVDVTLPDYIFFTLFIATELILPLRISFCAHHGTMKDVGFKLPGLQRSPSQLACSNQ